MTKRSALSKTRPVTTPEDAPTAHSVAAPDAGQGPCRGGTLYVVATPIGNRDDLTARAASVLARVAIVAAEDTRRAGHLLAKEEPRPRLLSLHAHNYRARLPQLLTVLEQGLDVALVTDAGTPGVSDPGGAVVAAAWTAGIKVVPLPGPSAGVTAISAAGFPAERYLFAGYVPKKPGRRERFWQWIDAVGETTVLFETPHRIERTLDELADRWPDRLMLLARELTKTHEELMRAACRDLRAATVGRAWKGEITIVLAPAAQAATRDSEGREREQGDDI